MKRAADAVCFKFTATKDLRDKDASRAQNKKKGLTMDTSSSTGSEGYLTIESAFPAITVTRIKYLSGDVDISPRSLTPFEWLTLVRITVEKSKPKLRYLNGFDLFGNLVKGINISDESILNARCALVFGSDEVKASEGDGVFVDALYLSQQGDFIHCRTAYSESFAEQLCNFEKSECDMTHCVRWVDDCGLLEIFEEHAYDTEIPGYRIISAIADLAGSTVDRRNQHTAAIKKMKDEAVEILLKMKHGFPIP